jgi:hypothetical protein
MLKEILGKHSLISINNLLEIHKKVFFTYIISTDFHIEHTYTSFFREYITFLFRIEMNVKICSNQIVTVFKN